MNIILVNFAGPFLIHSAVYHGFMGIGCMHGIYNHDMTFSKVEATPTQWGRGEKFIIALGYACSFATAAVSWLSDGT